MRVDKYLWSTRYFKTRSIATQACRKGAVRVNDAIVKPSREVYISDKISVRKNQLTAELYVMDLPKSRVGVKLVSQYCKNITPQETIELHEEVSENQRLSRIKGAGRPSKKERRDLEGFLDDDA